MKCQVCVLSFILLLAVVDCAKILFLTNTISKSHLLASSRFLDELTDRGHEVTKISAFPDVNQHNEKIKHIYVELDEKLMELLKTFMVNGPWVQLLYFGLMLRYFAESARNMVTKPEVLREIESEKYDLMILSYMFSEIPLVVAHKMKCPVVVFWPRGTLDAVDEFTGNLSPISSVPIDGLNKKMSFMDRVKDYSIMVMSSPMNQYFKWIQNKIYRETFPGEEYPPLDQLKRNVSLVLLNEHFTQSVPRPYVQNMIEVGGLQIKDKPSPLPEDIQKWLDNSPEGVIYLSMGSNFKFSYMSKEGIDVFKKAFGKLKQRILWTFDTDEMEGKPENVMIKKWFPQDDLLAHPNIKIFISHGGLGSVVESKYHGVPIIGIPQFGDQEQNVNGIVAEGWALKISKDNVTEDSLGGAIEEMLKNSAYSSKVKELSFLYRDRPKTALETAVFWVEYVIRHKGAPHMRFQGVDLNFFQKNSLDVLAFLSFIIYIIYRLIKLFFVILCKLVCGRRKKEKIN